jgi:hypothetical protein
MTAAPAARAHLVAGGFPPGASAGHDHDYVRLRLLGLIYEGGLQASVANDYADLARWLPPARLLVTYTAGPYPDAGQCGLIHGWLERGGHWLALHGSSGGRAERVEGQRQRRTVRTEHHELLGSRFLIHPPIRIFRVEVRDARHPLTRGLPPAFEIEDEPYCIELQRPDATQILLTADYGPDAAPVALGALYGGDASLQPDGRSRVLGYTRAVGRGAVTYFAFGHCHSPAARADRSDGPGFPAVFRQPWHTPEYLQLLRNAIGWAVPQSSR